MYFITKYYIVIHYYIFFNLNNDMHLNYGAYTFIMLLFSIALFKCLTHIKWDNFSIETLLQIRLLESGILGIILFLIKYQIKTWTRTLMKHDRFIHLSILHIETWKWYIVHNFESDAIIMEQYAEHINGLPFEINFISSYNPIPRLNKNSIY